jgi:DNA-binding MarR family transcriptional regulator
VQDDKLLEQAKQIESMLPRLMRRLLTLDPSHPVNELPLAQLRVCVILQTGAKTMSALSEELGISVSAITQIADRLETSGYVERLAGPDDRRMKMLQLTTLGAELMRARHETRVRRTAEALDQLTMGQRSDVIQAVRLLLEASEITAPNPPLEDPVGIRIQQ